MPLEPAARRALGYHPPGPSGQLRLQRAYRMGLILGAAAVTTVNKVNKVRRRAPADRAAVNSVGAGSSRPKLLLPVNDVNGYPAATTDRPPVRRSRTRSGHAFPRSSHPQGAPEAQAVWRTAKMIAQGAPAEGGRCPGWPPPIPRSPVRVCRKTNRSNRGCRGALPTRRNDEA